MCVMTKHESFLLTLTVSNGCPTKTPAAPEDKMKTIVYIKYWVILEQPKKIKGRRLPLSFLHTWNATRHCSGTDLGFFSIELV